MSDNATTAFAAGALSFLGYLIAGLDYESAAGALIGSFFFLSLGTVKGWKVVLLWFVSIGLGYMFGILAGRLGWGVAAGLVAFAGAAFGVTIAVALQKYFDGGPLPDFLVRILDRVPFLNAKRSDSNG